MVDLNGRTCICNKWDLSGIFCFYAVVVILDEGFNSEGYVDYCYSKEVFFKVYGYLINFMR